MSERRISIGKKGENLAVKYLKRQGYAIKARNFRTRMGEIDIVASEAGTIVFVEVKARTTAKFGTPAEAVNKAKQRQLSKVALEYIGLRKLIDTPARFDVVAILDVEGGHPEIELIRNAFDLIF